MQTTFS